MRNRLTTLLGATSLLTAAAVVGLGATPVASAAASQGRPPTVAKICAGANFTSPTTNVAGLTIDGTAALTVHHHGKDTVFFSGVYVITLPKHHHGEGSLLAPVIPSIPTITTCAYVPPAPTSGQPHSIYGKQANFGQGTATFESGTVTIAFDAGVDVPNGATICLRVFADRMAPVSPTVCGTVDAATDSFTPTIPPTTVVPVGMLGGILLGVMVCGGFALEQTRRLQRTRAALIAQSL